MRPCSTNFKTVAALIPVSLLFFAVFLWRDRLNPVRSPLRQSSRYVALGCIALRWTEAFISAILSQNFMLILLFLDISFCQILHLFVHHV